MFALDLFPPEAWLPALHTPSKTIRHYSLCPKASCQINQFYQFLSEQVCLDNQSGRRKTLAALVLQTRDTYCAEVHHLSRRHSKENCIYSLTIRWRVFALEFCASRVFVPIGHETARPCGEYHREMPDIELLRAS